MFLKNINQVEVDMAKKVQNLSHINYVILIKSMEQKNGFKAWNAYVAKNYASRLDDTWINLEFLNFQGFNLRGANLSQVSFTGSRLLESDLSGTDKVLNNLQNVHFRECDLRGANLSFAVLSGSSFTDATLVDEDGSNQTNLMNAILDLSTWERAYVIAQQLARAHIRGARNIDPAIAEKVAKLLYRSLTSGGNPDEKAVGEIESNDTPLPKATPLV